MRKQVLSISLIGLSILIFLIIMNGCSVPIYLIIYNNTSSEITLFITPVKSSQEYTIKKNKKLKIIFPNELHLDVICNKKRFSYDLIWPPKEYIGNLYENAVFLQIDPDRKIYILKNGDFPVKTFPEQPKGFPLIPSKSDKTK